MSSSRNKDQWIVPGGGVEPDETSSVAAVREVIEEAGVTGNIDRCLGVFEVCQCLFDDSVSHSSIVNTVNVEVNNWRKVETTKFMFSEGIKDTIQCMLSQNLQQELV